MYLTVFSSQYETYEGFTFMILPQTIKDKTIIIAHKCLNFRPLNHLPTVAISIRHLLCMHMCFILFNTRQLDAPPLQYYQTNEKTFVYSSSYWDPVTSHLYHVYTMNHFIVDIAVRDSVTHCQYIHILSVYNHSIHLVF